MISLIDAGPGTGKTFSLIYGYLILSEQLAGNIEPTEEQRAIFDYMVEEYKPRDRPVSSLSVCFFAHSRSVKAKLVKALKGTRAHVHTLHGAGYSVLKKRFGYMKVVNYRTDKHIKLITGQDTRDMQWNQKREWAAVKRICHYLKTEALTPTPENLEYLKLKYHDLSNYQIPDTWETDASDLLEKASIPDGLIEFADQPWLAAQHIRGPIYDLGLVDESQDVASSTYNLLTRLCRNVLFCGDKNQAINAFAGASEEMYDRIKQRSDAVLPLKMTQRCTTDICNIANSIRPGGILPGPNTQRSIIRTVDKSSLPEILVGTTNPANTLFLSRTNSTIINLAIYFHTKQIPFTIIDKDLATEINNFIKMFKASNMQDLRNKLASWLSRMDKCPNEFYRHSCRDKYDYITTILDQCHSIEDVFKFTKEAFDETKQGFKLTSAHKSKGLEAQNIFIVNPPIPLDFAMSHPIARDQEINLNFVAHTRSSLNLYFLK